MKNLKPILYCLLWATLAFIIMYFLNNREEKEIIIEQDAPNVKLKVYPTDISVWDNVSYMITSEIKSNNEIEWNNKIFYYDFNWDWERDLVSKNDTETHTFLEPYEDWIVPRVAVEFKWKADTAYWDVIYVKENMKPIFLYNSIWNIVIFRDLSRWHPDLREICFEERECESLTTKSKKVHVDEEIKKYDSFIRKYDNYGKHKVNFYLQDEDLNEIQTWYIIETSNNSENWRITTGLNLITIPETKSLDKNLEIYLSKYMENILLMYINNESWETCYVDTDISVDSNWDWKLDNDADILCNKIAKIVYDSNYESAIWRIYFTSKNNNIESQDFKVYIEQ